MNKQENNGTTKSSDEMRTDIEQTRERVSFDVEALGSKLSPENLKAEAKQAVKQTVQRGTEQLREGVSSAGSSLLSLVRGNPVPSALIGIGVGWLWWSAKNGSNRGLRRGPNYGAAGRAAVYDDSEEDPSLRERLAGGVKSVGRAAGQKAHQALEKVEELEGAAKHQAVRARDAASKALDEQPLILGAVALGAGIVVGLSIPATESENQLLGHYRDVFLEKAKVGAKKELTGMLEKAAADAP